MKLYKKLYCIFIFYINFWKKSIAGGYRLYNTTAAKAFIKSDSFSYNILEFYIFTVNEACIHDSYDLFAKILFII